MKDILKTEDIRETVLQYEPEEIKNGFIFELLDSLCDTDKQRALTEIRERIKTEKFGSVKDFDELWKAHNREKRYEKKQAARKEAKLEKGSIVLDAIGKEALSSGFEGVEEILDGNHPDYGKYYCSDSGVFYIGGSGEKETAVKVCSHPLIPSRRYVDVESGCESLDISYKLDGSWRKAALIDRETISQVRLITKLSRLGMDITSENAREIVKYLADIDSRNRSIIPRTNTISRLGWIDKKRFSPFIDGITYSSGKFSDMFSAIHTQGSFETWKGLAGQIMQDVQYRPARIVLAASVASPLLGWMGNQSFHVHLWSPESGTGKTLAQKGAASVWGDPADGAYLRSMNTTIVAVEQMDSFCNNLPLILDELQASSIDPESFIYCHCEGTGKARGAKEGGLRDQTHWKNIAITSGEQPLVISSNTKAGAINRVINIETHGQVIPGDMSVFADNIHDNYGFAGKAIIERIIQQPDFCEGIRATYRKAVSELNRYDLTGKQANYGASILVGDALLNQIVFNGRYEDLTPIQIAQYLATREMVDFNLRIQRWLCGFIESETAHFIKPDTRPSDVIDFKTKIYGEIKHDGSVLFNYEILSDLLAERRCNIASFMSWCNDHNLIETVHTDSCRHWDVNRKLKGIDHSVRVAEFKPEFFPQGNDPYLVRVETPFN